MKKLEKTNEVRVIPTDFFEQQAAHWDQRYGGMARDKKMWMLVGIIALMVLVIIGIGYVKQVSEGKYIPYIVEVDKVGESVSYKPAERISSVDQRIVEATLGRFIYCFRTVSIDKRTLKVNIDELYSLLNQKDPAYNKITQHFGKAENDPYKRAVTSVTSIDITNIMKMPSGEWILKWNENVFTRKGKLQPAKSGHYQAIVNTIIVPSSINNEKDMNLLNPIGIYIRDISWQQELTK